MTELPSVGECDVENQDGLARYRSLTAKWRTWLKSDPQSAIWPQIYSMVLEDLTYKSLAAAAAADPDGALHSPILSRGLTTGYAATQCLAIRRLVDEKRSSVISLWRLLKDILDHSEDLTRENYVCSAGGRFESEGIEHLAFERFAGTAAGRPRRRDDRIPKAAIVRLRDRLEGPEIRSVVEWSHKFVAHAGDPEAPGNDDMGKLNLTFAMVTAAQKQIVIVAERITTGLLREPFHGELVPVFQFNQFERLDMAVRNPLAVRAAREKWLELTQERNRWIEEVWRATGVASDC